MRTLLAILLSAGVAFGQANPGKTSPAQGPPPKNLTQRGDGHFSANSDPANPEKFEVHVVQTGETLSQIAGVALKDSRLWPQLWEQNEHIINPHWIYPNDKILIRPITRITDAVPPPVVTATPVPAPVPEPVTPPAVAAAVRPPQLVPTPTPPVAQDMFILTPPKSFPEVKTVDLYCSGFVRVAPVSRDLKVLSRYDGDGSFVASEGNYVYLNKGAQDGIQVGAMYQGVRSTQKVQNSARKPGDRNLGMHYVEVAQVAVVLTQAHTALARVIHNCDDLEIGDIMLPFRRIELLSMPRPRPFSPTMTTTSGIRGTVVTTLNVLLNMGSIFKGAGQVSGAKGGSLGALTQGIAGPGSIVYIDLGKDVTKPGDLFIVYRADSPPTGPKLKLPQRAVGELVVLKVEERVATALVTYSTDGISLGDAVERR